MSNIFGKSTVPSVPLVRRFLHVLGIESSCDDAAVAIVNWEGRQVLADRRSTDNDTLLRVGGVLPYVSARHHRSVLGPLISNALSDADLRPSDIGAVSVSYCPGIVLCLKVGVEHALSFARCFRRPLVPVHHLRAHSLVARLLHSHLTFPFLTLIASGAHCIICSVHSPNEFYVLAESAGGSPGECLDKLARELGLNPHKGSYAAQMEQTAKKCPPDEVGRFALPPSTSDDLMDFDAIKWRYLSLLNRRRKWCNGGNNNDDLAAWCAGIQHTVTELICLPLASALTFFASTNSHSHCFLVIAGGVAANEYFRTRVKRIAAQRNFAEVIVLPRELCTDNGVMVAWTGAEILAQRRERRTEKEGVANEEKGKAESDRGEEADNGTGAKGPAGVSDDVLWTVPESLAVLPRSRIGPPLEHFQQHKHLYS